jgi:hypothetical protein
MNTKTQTFNNLDEVCSFANSIEYGDDTRTKKDILRESGICFAKNIKDLTKLANSCKLPFIRHEVILNYAINNGFSTIKEASDTLDLIVESRFGGKEVQERVIIITTIRSKDDDKQKININYKKIDDLKYFANVIRYPLSPDFIEENNKVIIACALQLIKSIPKLIDFSKYIKINNFKNLFFDAYIRNNEIYSINDLNKLRLEISMYLDETNEIILNLIDDKINELEKNPVKFKDNIIVLKGVKTLQ